MDHRTKRSRLILRNLSDTSVAGMFSRKVVMQTATVKGRPVAAAVLGLCSKVVPAFRLM